MFNAAFWWAIAGLALMISELVVPGLVLFFFGIGALVTALLAWLLPLSLNAQIAIFIVSSLVSLFALRRFLKPIFTGRSTGTSNNEENAGSLVGQNATVTQTIEPKKTGRVLLNGTKWKATADETISEGTEVEVIKQDNLTLHVK